MKNTILCLGLIFMSQLAIGQNYDELKILYADENYEKLLDRALKYTEKVKTKKEPAPYFWAAKALYKIDLAGITDEKYKNAFKDAINYLSKGIKYDIKYEDRASIIEFDEFLTEFQISLYTRIMNEWEANLPKKAYSLAVKYTKITEHKVGAKYLAGACKFLAKDPGTSRALWVEGEKMLAEVTSVDGWTQADKDMLMMGILGSAEALASKRQKDKAKTLMNKVAQFFEDNEIWQAKYDEIVN